MQESTRGAESIRLPAAAIGILAGAGGSYLASYLFDHISVPEGILGIPLILTLVLFPFILLAAIAIISWTRNHPSENDALLQELIVSFWFPFFILYYVTYYLYWLNRVG